RTIMAEMGMAIMGVASASGEGRAEEAARKAIASPLLEDISIRGAKGVLINITGGPDLTLHEVNEAATLIQEEADQEANIIFGAVIDESLQNEIHITVIATGFGEESEPVQPTKPILSAIRTGRPNLGGSRKVVHLGTVIDDDLEVPTWQRKRQTDTASAMAHLQAEAEEKFDIPAFLRKQAN
ncbi:MAG: cell division protein FtsZ, partial [Candidatus Binatia bacterium]|nr:cell division protein FtsZ [Candidatus Binatia bacterium]